MESAVSLQNQLQLAQFCMTFFLPTSVMVQVINTSASTVYHLVCWPSMTEGKRVADRIGSNFAKRKKMEHNKRLEKKLWKLMGEIRHIQSVYYDDRQSDRAGAITKQINKAVQLLEDILVDFEPLP